MDSRIKNIADRLDFILKKDDNGGADAYMLRKDVKELLDEIRNAIRQDEATK